MIDKSHIANALEPNTYVPKLPDIRLAGAHLRDFAMKVDAAIPNGTYDATCKVLVSDGFARIVSNLDIDTSHLPGGTYGSAL
jgi:hypothetical protein